MGLARRRTRADLSRRGHGGRVARPTVGFQGGVDVADREPNTGPSGTSLWDSTNCNLRAAVHEFERRHISAVLTSVAGNKMKAARKLGIGLSSLYRKLEELGLAKEDSPQASTNCEECSRMASNL